MRQKIGILGATGMVGQRFIQLLENHPWFEVAWLAASERSGGKVYGDAVRWKLETPLPERVAALPMSAAKPDGAPKVIFAALDADIARELEPKFAAAGCAVISNSSAFRMESSIPLVIPEVNADHLALIENQNWRKRSGGYIVTNPNCSAIGLVLALKPIVERFGVEAIFVSTMQAVSGAGYPGVASLDILGNVVPFIGGEELVAAWAEFAPLAGKDLPMAPVQPVEFVTAEDRPQPRLDRMRGAGMAATVGRLRPCGLLDWKFTVLSHNTIRGAAGAAVLNAELLVSLGKLDPVAVPA